MATVSQQTEAIFTSNDFEGHREQMCHLALHDRIEDLQAAEHLNNVGCAGRQGLC